MDVKGEVQNGSTLGEFAYIAIGRKDKNLACRGLGIETLRERVRGLLQRLPKAAEPLLRGLRTLIHTLITPVRRDTSLGYGIHTLGAYLYLHPATAACRHGGVQRLVAVGLGDGNPIAHTLGVGRVAVAHDRIDRPAELLLQLTLAVDDDAQGEDVVNTLERNVLLTHLIPDGIYRLGAALDVVAQVGNSLQLLLDGHQEAGDEGLTLALGLLQSAGDIFVVLGLQPLQRYILQLALQGIQTQLMGYGGVEVHTLPALLAVLGHGEDVEATHNL